MELLRRQFTYTDDLTADFLCLVDTAGGDADACWPWGGTVTVHGYGSWLHSPAHRYAYTLHYGSIPPGLVVDHECHDPAKCTGGPKCPHRRCVNPTHLKAVPHAVNVSPQRSSNGRPANHRCSVAGCDRPYVVLNDGSPLCDGHRQRLKKHGDVFADRAFHFGLPLAQS
ncbi:HNH endonuclease signature motif containing protein [Streptomyces sp. NPDC005148]